MEPLQLTIIIAVIFFAAIGIGFLILLIYKTMRAPNIYYAPTQRIEELASELMCPRCGMRNLTPIGKYTIECRTCGFTFNVGRLRLRGERTA